MYAYLRKPLNNEPWIEIDDARLLDDFDWGCSVFTMAKRALRSEEEVLARLTVLGKKMDAQPRGRRIRDITWSRR